MAVTVRIEVEHDDGEMTIVRQSVVNDIRPGALQRTTAQLIGDAVGQIITASAAGSPVRLGEMVGIVSQNVSRVIPSYGTSTTPIPVLRRQVGDDTGMGDAPDASPTSPHECDGVGCC